MMRYASIALIVALIAFALGFLAPVLATGAIWIAKITFFIALILFVAFFVSDMVTRRKRRK